MTDVPNVKPAHERSHRPLNWIAEVPSPLLNLRRQKAHWLRVGADVADRTFKNARDQSVGLFDGWSALTPAHRLIAFQRARARDLLGGSLITLSIVDGAQNPRKSGAGVL
jgi:hypothetical protein